MSGTVCLQGGAEFGARCRALDAELLRRAGAGPVVVVPLASRPGHEWRAAGDNGRRHFLDLGATDVVVPADAAEAVEAVAGSAMTFLPGGSPGRLLDAVGDAALAAAIRDVPGRGAVLAGASAGAMVLCGHTLLPDRRAGGEVPVVPGLGVVAGALVVPHFSGDEDRLAAVGTRVPDDVTVVGLPECGGVIVDGEGRWTASGDVWLWRSGSSQVVTAGGVVRPDDPTARG